MRKTTLLLALTVVLSSCRSDAPHVKTAPEIKSNDTNVAKAQVLTNESANPNLQLIAQFMGPMPTGVAVSKTGRTFINYPRWGDGVEYSVIEITNGKATAYPEEKINKLNTSDPANSLIGVQSVVMDDKDRLWIVDTGSINFQPVISNGPKLLCVDLTTNKIIKRIDYKQGNAVLPTSYTNDVRFDLNRGKEGMAFITDSSDKGPNGIICVDIATGQSWRRLNDHPSTHAEANFVPTVEGEPLMSRPPGGPDAYIKIGSDGIAITPDGKTLYYRPLASHHLYSVSVDALADRAKSEDQVAATVKDLGDIGFASDGLECGKDGTLYLTDYENNAIRRRTPDGKISILVQDPRMIWPDSMSLANNWLYVTANQLNRQKQFHQGQDLRKQPYLLLRYPISSPHPMEPMDRP